MRKLNDTILKDILVRRKIDEEWKKDCSSLLTQGVSLRQIGLVIDTANQLEVNPLLTEEDLIEDGVTLKEIEHTFINIAKLKSLLGISYYFENYLADNHLDRSSGVAIPYFIYQHFHKEIRKDYSDDVELNWQIRVELSNDLAVSAIPLFGQYTAIVPATDKEAAGITAALLADRYQCLSYDSQTSLLELETIDDTRKVQIEVRCLSSKFKSNRHCGVCVVDDDEICHPRSKQSKRLSFAHLLKRHMAD
ncbi:hypothetical protein DLI08_17465 [Vibrio parahaemolyticus]|nr:hypothetical protein [Vibrio parahaemolyticus]EGX6075366.1 hypothetical protein [Vibrio parahaemolyticus]EKG9563495.1 hypothetical protein [Vibrio parahaemolyticus]EKG9663040.1 hypothetical protein [Vibrio parahaemolyticus]EKG9668525.1 hypothetical protein [Vibrio parahaemolyticus]